MGLPMGLPKVPYFGETNPVMAAQLSARMDWLRALLRPGSDHDTMPDLSASGRRSTVCLSTTGRVRDASCTWLCEP